MGALGRGPSRAGGPAAAAPPGGGRVVLVTASRVDACVRPASPLAGTRMLEMPLFPVKELWTL